MRTEVWQKKTTRLAQYPLIETIKMNISYAKTELLKWIALVLMLGDHINKFLFNGNYSDFLFNAGRLCLPIFVFVLAANLVKTDKSTHKRTMLRIFIFGVIASVPYYLLGAALPLNVLFTLLLIVVVIYLMELRAAPAYFLAAVAFILGGAFVEYWWPAIIMGVALFYFLKYGSKLCAALALTALVSLFYINGNHYALLALPLILITPKFSAIPRLRWAFYIFYPLHLAALLLVRIPMAAAGYLFF